MLSNSVTMPPVIVPRKHSVHNKIIQLFAIHNYLQVIMTATNKNLKVILFYKSNTKDRNQNSYNIINGK